MTEEERKALLREKAILEEIIAKAEGRKRPAATLKGQDAEIFEPSKVPTPTSLLNQPLSGRMAASKAILPTPKAKARPVNAPDTGATSLVTNKVKVTPAPARTQPTAKTQGTPTRRLTYDQAQKALTASGGGTPAKGLEAVDKAFKDVQKAKESQSPRALDKQFAAELALKQALGESTMKGRTAEQLRQGEVLRQGRGTPYVAPDTAQQDLEAAVITTLLGIAPGVGGQLAIGAAGKLIPEATQAARPMLSNLLKGGAAIGGAAGTAKAQDIALENVLGQDQYTKMQQNLAEFQGRQPLLTSMLQGGAGAIMQRPSLAASLGERLVGAGMGAGLSVGGDIMAGQPADLSKAGIEALANAALAGPNTKSGDVLESLGGKAVAPLVPKVSKAPKAFSGILKPPTAPQGVSFVDPNAPTPAPVTKIGTTAQAPAKPKVTLPTGEAGKVSPESLITTAPTQRKGKTPVTAPETPPAPALPVKETAETFTRPAKPVKETAETFTRPAKPVKETPKSEQVVGEPPSTVVKEPVTPAKIYIDGLGNTLPDYIQSLKPGDRITKDGDTFELSAESSNPSGKAVPYWKIVKSGKPQVRDIVLGDYKGIKVVGTPSNITPEPVKGEVTPSVVKEPLSAAKQDHLISRVTAYLGYLNSPDNATSGAAQVKLKEVLATLRDNAIIKGEGVKTTGKIVDKDTFAQSVKDAFGVTDEQAGELSDLVDDWANGWAKKERESGRLPDATAADFYATIGGIHRFDDDLAQLVLGKKAATSKGARLPESKVIVALQKGDATTAVHEMAHHFLDTLPEAARKKVMDSLPGTTASNVHEQFATGFEAGLKDANSPLHRYYKKFKMWIDETYKGLVNKWKSLAGYEEGALKVTSTEKGKNVVSFTAGLKGDALDVVMDYINTGRMAKGSAVEGVTAPKADAVDRQSLVDAVNAAESNISMLVRAQERLDRNGMLATDADRKSINRRKPGIANKIAQTDGIEKQIRDAIKKRDSAQKALKDLDSKQAGINQVAEFNRIMDQLNNSPESVAIRKEEEAQRAQTKAESEALLSVLSKEKSKAESELSDWQGRTYKDNKTTVTFEGDGPTRNESMSIGTINRNRKSQQITALKESIDRLSAIESTLGDHDKSKILIDQIKEAWADAGKRVSEGALDSQESLFEYIVNRDLLKVASVKGTVASTEASRALLNFVKKGSTAPKVETVAPKSEQVQVSKQPQSQTGNDANKIKPIRARDVQDRYEDFKKLALDNPRTYETPDGNIVTLGNRRDSAQFFTVNGKDTGWDMPEAYSKSEILREIDELVSSGKVKAPKPIDFVAKNARQLQPYAIESVVSRTPFSDYYDIRERQWRDLQHFRQKARDYVPPTPEEKSEYERITGRLHRKAVTQALTLGVPVPPEVLADYPDLAVKYGKTTEPQFQTDDSANESTILGIPLKNSAIQGFFDVDPDTLKDNSTTIEAERKKALDLANSPGFAEKVVADILDGKKVISPTLTAENMVAAAEAAKRRMAWETAKASDAPQAEVDKAFADYMKFVQATKDIGTEVALAMRMRQEAIGSDPLDPDSYISRAASTFTRDLNDPKFKEFVDKISAKSDVARQSYDNLQAEIARLNAQVDELLKGTPAETEVKKAEAEQQVFGTATVPKRKKVAEGTTGATEGQKSAGGATTPRVSGTTAKVKSNANRDRAFAKLKSDKISDSVSSIAKEALSIAQGLASKYGGKKVQFQSDDDIDVDTQDISEFRRDMIVVGRGLLAAGTRNFKTWKEEIGGILDDAGIDPLEEHQYQVLWVDSKLSLRDEVGDVQSIKSSTAGTTIQQVIGSLGLDGAGRWLDGISDQDGNPTIFEKMVKGEDLTPAELDGAARVWMEVQRASGLKVSKRGKVGALADIRRIASELKRSSAPAVDVTMDKALESIKRMTDKLGKQAGTTVTPVLRARLSRFNALAVALAKKSIGTEKGQLSTTEFTALVDSAAQAFRDAGSDVEKHQQVLRDLRNSVLKARGLDPNARYQFSGKSDATLRAETDAKFAQDGQALVDLVKSYASGRKQSIPNPLLDVATAEYAKAGDSLTAWAKAVENRWGSKLDRDQLDALYAQAGMKFASMKDPATGVPYAVQIRRIKEQMEYEVQKLTYDQLSPADKAIRSLGEIGMAITGNVASFDYSFAGRQAGTALILARTDYAKALLAGIKATGIGKVSPEQQALIFDNVSSAFFNDRFGSADYYKKVGLEITDDAFSDIYTHHGLITPNGRMVSEALSTVGVRPALDIAAKAAEKRGDTAKAQALRARAENMRGPGQRSEAMNRMFVKQLRFDLFRRLTKDGMVYKRLTDQLESATTDAEKKAIQQKITYQEEYNKMVAKMISITTGKAAVERASVRNMLTTLGRVGIWSPSFWLSRVQAMTAYPAWDVVFGQNDLKAVDRLKLAAYPIALQQAEIQAFNLALFLLSRIPGVQIMGTDDDEAGGRKTPWNWLGADPLNTDFGKVKYEGQEYDLSAGMRKHIVFAQRSYELAAQGYEDWWREQKGQLPKDNEYDPYYDSKVTVEDGKRQLLQYIKSSMNPVAGTIYDITRGGAEDALGRKMSPLETSLRMIVPIPLANVAYSTLVDRPEEARRAAQTQDPTLMQRVQDNGNTFVRDTILTSFADMVGVSSAVRDRELEDGIKQASKHSGWMSKGYIPSKKDDELRNEVTKLLKDSIALSGTGDTYPSKKEIDLQAREVLKMLPLARMDRESLLAEKKKLAEQVAKGKKVHRYMKTTPFSINGNLPK